MKQMKRNLVKADTLTNVCRATEARVTVAEAKPIPLMAPSGKLAVSFWVNISNDELHAIKEDTELLIELQKLVSLDPFFYFTRSEPNDVSVFSNSKGSVKLPVKSFKLGDCVYI